MKAAPLQQQPAEVAADALILPVFSGVVAGPGVADVDAALGGGLLDAVRDAGLAGERGDVLAIPTLGRLPSRTVLLVGLGDASSAGPAAVRIAAAYAGRALAGRGASAVVAGTLGQVGSPEESAQAFAEGVAIGAHAYGAALDGATAGLQVHALVAAGLRETAVGLERAVAYADAVNWTRDLVNMPADDATPAFLAGTAASMAADEGLECTVLEGPGLERGGFGGVLGVGRGSANEPRFVELFYHGCDGPELALAGKGITFDAGGLHVKRQEELSWMRSDMAGAASVLAAVRALARLGVPVNVRAALPFAENLPDGRAIRPGDVLTHRGGRRSEVVDTDNEGRLVLADALAHLAARRPQAMVDVGTLTDAGGLGPDLWAVMANDRALAGELLAAGERAGEPGWELPLWRPYQRELVSDVAEVRNAARENDTTIMAALFLDGFVGGVPWAHIDNGSSGWMEHPNPPWSEGATGSPARTLIEWVRARATVSS